MANKKNKTQPQRKSAPSAASSSKQASTAAEEKQAATEAVTTSEKAAQIQSTKKAQPKKQAASSKKADKVIKAKKKSDKPGLFSRIGHYFSSVRSEMRRCVWPSKKELINYSLAVCVSLIVVGIAIAIVDAIIGQGLVLFAGLRG